MRDIKRVCVETNYKKHRSITISVYLFAISFIFSSIFLMCVMPMTYDSIDCPDASSITEYRLDHNMRVGYSENIYSEYDTDTFDKDMTQLLRTLKDSSKLHTAINVFHWMCTHISYEYDDILYGVKEYYASPQECMCYQKGDCEDYCILMSYMYDRLGIDNQIVRVRASDCYHVFIIADLDGFGQTYQYHDRTYTIIDPTQHTFGYAKYNLKKDCIYHIKWENLKYPNSYICV